MSDDIDQVRRYAASYQDLLIWLSRSGDVAALREHMQAAERHGRVAPDTAGPPDDWSDTYLRSVCQDADYAELLRLGVAASGYDYAHGRFGAAAGQHGRIAEARNLVTRSQLPAPVLGQLMALDRRLGAQSPLATLVGPMPHVEGADGAVLLPCLEALRRAGTFGRGYDVGVLVPWLETGGAELGAWWFYRGAAALGLKPVLIITDKPIVTPFFAEQGLEVINLPAEIAAATGRAADEIAFDLRKLLLAGVLKRLGLRVIHLVHSWLGYNLFGDAEYLRQSSDRAALLVSVFCPHVHVNGRIDGYYRHFPALDARVATYLYDNLWYLRQIAALYGIEDERARVICFPTRAAPWRPRKPRGDLPARVLWASRLDYQKNPDIVFRVARALPDVAFDMYGRQVLNDATIDWNDAPDNVSYCGEFFDFAALPLERYALFLYTSLFDGMPNILLEAAAHGLPIVSSAVGGIAEFLDGGAGILVEGPHDVNGYAAGIAELLADEAAAAGMAAMARGRIDGSRSFESFVEALAEVPAYRAMLDDAGALTGADAADPGYRR